MKAALLAAFGSPLAIETLPDPVLGTGEVVVDVVAAPVLSYTGEVLSGKRKYLLVPPVVPGSGAVGRVRATGPDATRLKRGDWVLCDPTVRSRDNALNPDINLQGLSARGDGGLRLQEYFHDGSFAQQMRVPTENAIPIGTLEGPAEAGQWCALNTLLVPFGGLLAADFQAGETLLVSGATGNFGSSAVAVALAMGAGCVIAPGRNEKALEDLVRRFGSRVRPVKLLGDEEDSERMKRVSPSPIDCVLDILPPSAPAKAARAAMMAVRPYGRIVLMGGVGMLGGEGLELPYPWIMRNNVTIRGQWMYPSDAVYRMVSLIRAGLLDLSHFDVTAFALDAVNEAVAHAAATSAPFKLTVLQPSASLIGGLKLGGLKPADGKEVAA